LLDEHVALRALEAGDVLEAKRIELVFIGKLARLHHEHCDDRLTPLRVGFTEHRGLLDRRML